MKLPETLVFATNNAHKLQEARSIFEAISAGEGKRCKIMSLSEIGCNDDITEDAETLEGNAVKKAEWVWEHYGCDCFADDTGLEVEVLGGLPGVHTARFASMENGEAKSHDSAANMRLLLEKLEGKENRKARFRTAIALIAGGEKRVFEGWVDGIISTTPRGDGGFGYDPVFIPTGYSESFAEMSSEKKNELSHRGRALQSMYEYLEKNN